MHKNQNQSIKILLTCVDSFLFHANHYSSKAATKNQIKSMQLSIEELRADNYSNSA